MFNTSVPSTIRIQKRGVCLSVRLFGIGAQTTGWIPTKFDMGHPLGPVGNLKILFGVEPPGGGKFLEKLKKLLLRHHLRRKLARTARLDKRIQI